MSRERSFHLLYLLMLIRLVIVSFLPFMFLMLFCIHFITTQSYDILYCLGINWEEFVFYFINNYDYFVTVTVKQSDSYIQTYKYT